MTISLGAPLPTVRMRLLRLTVLFAAHALGTANITLVLAFAPSIQREFGLSPGGFGLAVAAYYGGQMFFALPAGWLVDRFGVRRVLLAAHVTMASGTGLIAVADSTAYFIVGIVLCGLGYALVNPSTARGVLSWFNAQSRATAMGAKQTGVPAGAIALALIATAWDGNWRSLALILSVTMLVTTMMYLVLEPSRRAVARPDSLLRGLLFALTHRRLAVINFGTCCYTMALGALLAYFVTFAYEVVQVSASTASLFLALVQAASAAGRVAWGIVGDWLPKNGRVVGLVICGLLGAAGCVLLPFAGSPAELAVLTLILGLTIGGFSSLAQTHAVESVEPSRTGAAVGYNLLFTTGGSMLGPMLFAFFLGLGGYELSWIMVAVALVVGAILFKVSSRGA